MAEGPDNLEDSSFEEGESAFKAKTAAVPSASRPRRARQAAGVRQGRLSDLNSSMDVHKALCASMDGVSASLRRAMNEVLSLERAERSSAPDSPRLSSSVREIAAAVDSVLARATESLAEAERKESDLMDSHGRVCSHMDDVARELRSAAALAALLDRRSGSGFNVEVRLSRRLNVSEIRRTLDAAHANVSRTVRMSRAKAGFQGRVVEDLIDEAPTGFE